jgi:anti-sigma factor RsiW
MTCKQIEPLLAAYVDGAAPADDAAAVAAHVAGCESCRWSLETQTSIRRALQSRAAELSPLAPPGLRTRIAATLSEQASGESGRTRVEWVLGWRGRLSAFAAALVTVLVLGAVLLPIATTRSTVLLAAQMALDHLKCFTIDGDGTSAPIARQEAEATLQREYGWTMSVPAGVEAEGLQLVAVRRCLYGDGRAAHLLYRLKGEPVSLFVIPGLSRPATELSLMGHDHIVWTEGDRTYMLVSRAGTKDALARVALHLQNEAK